MFIEENRGFLSYSEIDWLIDLIIHNDITSTKDKPYVYFPKEVLKNLDSKATKQLARFAFPGK